jgi:cyclophilin family peptidyl-prolyl cis-trans isomerase
MAFFDANNADFFVQLQNQCGIDGHFWVFAEATTDVEYTLRVTDTQTGISKAYDNPLGVAGGVVTDTQAFATCP